MIDTSERPQGSSYLQWIRAQASVRFNLGVSGAPDVHLSELPALAADLELTTTHGYGYPPLLNAIAARYGVGAENVATAGGCTMANHLALAALIRPGDEVLIEWPVYEPLLSTIRYVGGVIRTFQRDPKQNYAVDPERLVQRITPQTRLVVLTNLHNPSGMLLDEDALRDIGRAAERVGAKVLVDEVYLDLVHPALRSAVHLGPQFVVTNSLTKIYGLSGLRCGWILASAETIRRIWRLNDLYEGRPVHAGERLSLAAFPYLDGLRDRLRTCVEQNRKALYQFYDRRSDIDALCADRGTTAFPRLCAGSADRLCALLRERYDTAIVPGRFFGLADHIRIGLACDTAVFAEGIERLEAALNALR